MKQSVRAFWGTVIFFSLAAVAWAQSENPSRVEIDLNQQTAYLIRGRRVVMQSPISSGRYGHLTETGSFKVIEKERNHYSSIYGKIVDSNGRAVVADADVDMKVPRGCKFVPAPMPYFMRFHGSDGMHAGYLPGYPASHGCVRMPDQLAIAFYNAVDVGTPVTVFGHTPRTNEYFRYGPQPQRGFSWPWSRQQIGPQYEPQPRVYDSRPVYP
ncbi:MAG TPA: L,D-transpeptidase [Chthoniobacterales bacterium]|nr:L,D-transpeptidase [Chthoniobacterales bacterium]